MCKTEPKNIVYNYVLAFESKVWSIVLLPFIVLNHIFKYINVSIALSIFRISWIPMIIYIWYYQIIPLSLVLGPDGYVLSSNVGLIYIWLLIGVILLITGVISFAFLLIEQEQDVNYLKSKWMWK